MASSDHVTTKTSLKLTDADIAAIVERFRGPQGVEVKDRFRGFTRYRRVFLANIAIEWLMNKSMPTRISRTHAMELAAEIQAQGVIVNLSRPGETIKDDTAIFHFNPNLPPLAPFAKSTPPRPHRRFTPRTPTTPTRIITTERHLHKSSTLNENPGPRPTSQVGTPTKEPGSVTELRKWKSTVTLVQRPGDEHGKPPSLRTRTPTDGTSHTWPTTPNSDGPTTAVPGTPTRAPSSITGVPGAHSLGRSRDSSVSGRELGPSLRETERSGSPLSAIASVGSRAYTPSINAPSIIESVPEPAAMIDTSLEDVYDPPIPSRMSQSSRRMYPLPIGEGTAAAAIEASRNSPPSPSPPPMSFSALMNPMGAVSVLETDDLLTWAVGEWDKRLGRPGPISAIEAADAAAVAAAAARAAEGGVRGSPGSPASSLGAGRRSLAAAGSSGDLRNWSGGRRIRHEEDTRTASAGARHDKADGPIVAPKPVSAAAAAGVARVVEQASKSDGKGKADGLVDGAGEGKAQVPVSVSVSVAG